MIGAFTGTRGNLIEVGCNVFAGDLSGSRVRFDATAGATYHFVVGRSAADGESRLVFSPDMFPEPLLEVELTADPAESIDPRTGLVTLTGTAVCSTPASLVVDGNVSQGTARGYLLSEEVACASTPVGWIAVTAYVDRGRLRPSAADAFLVGYAWSQPEVEIATRDHHTRRPDHDIRRMG